MIVIGRDQSLHHPRRAFLYQYVRDNPGVSFNALLRGTGFMSGTARHHLAILHRSGLIVERRHRATCRYFENHGKYDAVWDRVVLLREPDLRRLHEWLTHNPLATQKAIIAAAQTWGWVRSSTQHRLSRLCAGRLVTMHRRGRFNLYCAEGVTVGGLPWSPEGDGSAAHRIATPLASMHPIAGSLSRAAAPAV